VAVLLVRGVAAGPTEQAAEHLAEAQAERAVDEEVDGRVDRHQQVARPHQQRVGGRRRRAERLHDVRHVRRQVQHLNPQFLSSPSLRLFET